MALGALTKQLAAQAIGNSIDNVLETRPEKPAPTAPPEPLGAAILAQIQAMQKALKEDQELLALCNTATESVRVLEIYVPSPRIFVLTGLDAQKNVTRIISPVENIQLVCKVMKVQPGAKATKIALITAKAG